MNRRSFFGSILAFGVAPAIVRVDSLMRPVARDALVVGLRAYDEPLAPRERWIGVSNELKLKAVLFRGEFGIIDRFTIYPALTIKNSRGSRARWPSPGSSENRLPIAHGSLRQQVSVVCLSGKLQC